MSTFSDVRRFMWLGAALLSACAGNGMGLDANGQPLGPGSGATEPLTADFQSIQDNVFTPICVPCHNGAGAPEGLQLDAAHSYALLVGVPSTEEPQLARVQPGAPASSYIVLKLLGSAQIVGAQMPFGEPPLPQSTIDVIRQWITDGAGKAALSSTAVARFAVIASSPAAHARIAAPLPQIVVAFNHELDATLINDTTVELAQLTGLVHTPTVGLSLQLATGNPSVLLIRPRRALLAGDYRLTLRSGGGGALADVNAEALANDYVSDFTVEGAP